MLFILYICFSRKSAREKNKCISFVHGDNRRNILGPFQPVPIQHFGKGSICVKLQVIAKIGGFEAHFRRKIDDSQQSKLLGKPIRET